MACFGHFLNQHGAADSEGIRPETDTENHGEGVSGRGKRTLPDRRKGAIQTSESRTHEERRGKFKRRNGQIGTDHMDQEKTQNDNFLSQLAFC